MDSIQYLQKSQLSFFSFFLFRNWHIHIEWPRQHWKQQEEQCWETDDFLIQSRAINIVRY